MIHGGPTGIDRPTPVPCYVYSALQWLDKGALILRPNYRGSAGYGEKNRELKYWVCSFWNRPFSRSGFD